MDTFDESFDHDGDQYDSDEECYPVCEKKPVRKGPSFETLTTENIVNLMEAYIKKVATIVELPATTIRILLSHTKWDKDELLSKLTDDNRCEFFAKANVIDPFVNTTVIEKSSHQNVTCGICFTEFFQKELLSLGCGHEYCKECWQQYLTIKITDEGAFESIQCPTERCNIIVDDDFIMRIISDGNVRQKYQHLMTNSFVQHDPSLRWCPAPGCQLAIRDNGSLFLGYRQDCECTCGYRCCFNCGSDSHDPIECDVYAKWKRDDNDETAVYIMKNTKSCPNTKCMAPIEKNGGCNYMRCQKCKYEFCWLCFGKWGENRGDGYEKHGTYGKCSLYDPEKEGKDDKARLSNYLAFYATYKESLAEEKKIDIDKQIQKLQDEGVSWNQAKYLKKALETLWECRKQQMLMCIFAYLVGSNAQKEIFEMNQGYLHSATEQLSMYLEKEITDDNAADALKNVHDKAKYCELCLNKLKDHIHEGFDNEWWSFDQILSL